MKKKAWIHYEDWKALRAFNRGEKYIKPTNPAKKSLEVIYEDGE